MYVVKFYEANGVFRAEFDTRNEADLCALTMSQIITWEPIDVLSDSRVLFTYKNGELY